MGPLQHTPDKDAFRHGLTFETTWNTTVTTHDALPLKQLYVDVSAPSPMHSAATRPGTAAATATATATPSPDPHTTPVRGSTAPAAIASAAAWGGLGLSPVPQGPTRAGGRQQGQTQNQAPQSAGVRTRSPPAPTQRPVTAPDGVPPRGPAPAAAAERASDPVPKALHLLKRAQTTGDLSKRGTLLSSAVSTCESLSSTVLTRHLPSARKKGDGLGTHRQKKTKPASAPVAAQKTTIDAAKWNEILESSIGP